MMHLTERIEKGVATQEDVDLLVDVARQIKGKCLCALGEFSIEAVLSGIDRFHEDFITAVARPEAVTGGE
jgi:NADH-quinone oxidoreductase subunit F